MISTWCLLLSELQELRTGEGETGIPDARDVQAPDRDPVASQRMFESIRGACAELSVEVEETTRRYELDDKRYYTGIPEADVVSILAASASSAAVMVALLRTTRPWIVRWLKNRASRSVRIRIGDREVEIHGNNDISAAIAALRRIEKVQSIARGSRASKRKPKKK